MRTGRVLGACALVIAAFGGAAIAQPPEQPTAEPPTAEQPTPAQLASDDARRAQAVARVGDAVITVGDVEDEVASLPPFQRLRYTDPTRLRELAEGLVRLELMAAAAAERGFDGHPEVRKSTQQQLVQNLILERFGEETRTETVPDEEVAAYYENNPDQFNQPEVRRAHHILVESEAEARELLRELDGADLRRFRQVARERSLDIETKLRGGDLRYFMADGRSVGPQRPVTGEDPAGSDDGSPMAESPGVDPRVDEDLAAAAFAMSVVGEIHPEPVAVAGKFSVVMLSGRRGGASQTLEEAAPSIRLRLFRENRQERIDALVQSLRREHVGDFHPERMEPIHFEVERTQPRRTGEKAP